MEIKGTFCNKHNMLFFNGRPCSECKLEELEERQQAAKIPHWRDLIPLNKILDFLKAEELYCRDESQEFYNCEQNDKVRKETLRAIVLEKRQEFLQLFLQILKDEKQSGEA